MNKATFAAGCFWGIEEAYRSEPGVTETAVGYLGGHLESPSYEDVCTGQTGHAEVVEVTFDPDVTSYKALLEIFWQIHDPTTLNRQGPDFGSQYRSAIFIHSEQQRIQAEASKHQQEENGKFEHHPIVTEITPATIFFRAEEYHQQYLDKRRMTAHHTANSGLKTAY